MQRSVTFRCLAPEARTVTLVGDFNNWEVGVHRMTRHPNGCWQIALHLNRGNHHYHFLVDGQPVLDPLATGVARNDRDERVSLLALR
jgi:1,4-alpha-glucan branching enzyme